MQTTFSQRFLRYKGYFSNILSFYQKRADVKRYLELLLSLAAVSVFSLFAIKPTVATIVGLVKEINAKEESLLQMEQKIDNLKTAQNTYNQYREAIEILDVAIPDSPSPDSAARQIEGLVTTGSINIGSIAFLPVVLKGADSIKKSDDQTGGLPAKTKAISVNLSGNGDYDLIKTFLFNLEAMRRPFKVDTIIISKKTSEDASEGQIVFSVSGRIPYYSYGQ